MHADAIKIARIVGPSGDPAPRQALPALGRRLLFEALDSTIARVETDAGLDGIGEGCAWGSTDLPAYARRARVPEGPGLGVSPRAGFLGDRVARYP